MYHPSLTHTVIFALFAGTHLVSGNPVPQDVPAAVGSLIGVAGAVAAPAAGDLSSCTELESSMPPCHYAFFRSFVLSFALSFALSRAAFDYEAITSHPVSNRWTYLY